MFGLKKIPLESAGFLTVGFSAEVEVIFSTKFLKDSVVWTGLCVAPAFMLSFSCWVAMSAAKCLLFFWLYICLNELLLCFCFSRALISSAKFFLKGPAVLD